MNDEEKKKTKQTPRRSGLWLFLLIDLFILMVKNNELEYHQYTHYIRF